MIRGPISLADLALAIETLEPTEPAATERIGRLLGLSRQPEARREGGVTESVRGPAENSPAGRAPEPERKKRGKTRGARADAAPERDRPAPPATRSRLDPIAEHGRRGPPRAVPPLASLLKAREPGIPARVEPSLFIARWRRALLTTTLSTPAPDGPVDAESVVRSLASGAALTRLPRLTVPSMRHGVQLLLDRRTGMRPFARDQERLRLQVGRVAGRDRLKVFYFPGCPSRGVRQEPIPGGQPAVELDQGPVPYQPPDPRVPVLLLSDLGIGAVGICRERADHNEWLAFARRLRANGNRLIALVPFPPGRWPSNLRRAMLLIHWDRDTSVGAIRRILSGAHIR